MKRINIGNYFLEDACQIDEFKPEKDIIPPQVFIKRMENVDILQVNEYTEEKVKNGVPLLELGIKNIKSK